MKKLPTSQQLTDEAKRTVHAPLLIYRDSADEEMCYVIGRVGQAECVVLDEVELRALRNYLVALFGAE
jgi:hypothetical protein